MKLKKAFRFIAFEPYSICAKLLRCNAGINGIGPEFQVEQIALSDQVREKAALRVNSMENQGGNSLGLALPTAASLQKSGGRFRSLP